MKLYQMSDDISVFKGYERKTDAFPPVLKTPIPRILMKISLHIGSPSKPFYFLYLDLKSSFQKIKVILRLHLISDFSPFVDHKYHALPALVAFFDYRSKLLCVFISI